jgi:hypothetical protein
MTPATLNSRPAGSFVSFPVEASEGDQPIEAVDLGTPKDNSDQYGNFVDLAGRLLTVSKDELSEAMTREIESDPAATAELRRARNEVRSGRSSTQEEIDQD